jgi:CheY-like chemotaxis protein
MGNGTDYYVNEVVALSADCQDSTKMLCLSAGMNSFLSKPLKKSEFGVILLN